MNKEEQKIVEDAKQYVKKYKKDLIQKFADLSMYPPDQLPVSVFMAGSPGAGKTEFSKELVNVLFSNSKDKYVVRIDADEIRNVLPSYNGMNSYLFQPAASIAVEKLHDHVLSKKQNFILDGTLSNFEKAKDNIKRSIKKGRSVFIFYVYQEPVTAWEFTQHREKKEGRHIPKEIFIDQFFSAKDTVNRIKEHFGKQIVIYLVEKDLKQKTVNVMVNVDKIDNYIKFKYTKDSLIEALKNI